MSLPPPGWHPDPSRPGRLRYWDGAAWTTWVSDHGLAVEDPLPDRAMGIQRWPARVVWVCMAGLLGITAVVAVLYLVGGGRARAVARAAASRSPSPSSTR